jgi:hypothetical protein
MGKLMVVVIIVGALAYAWHAGWIAQWFNSALDSGIEGVRGTQRKATTVRSADPGAEQKQ